MSAPTFTKDETVTEEAERITASAAATAPGDNADLQRAMAQALNMLAQSAYSQAQNTSLAAADAARIRNDAVEAQRIEQLEAAEIKKRDAKVEDLSQAIAQIDVKAYKDQPELAQGLKALKRGLSENDSRITTMMSALVDTQLYSDKAAALEASKGDGTGLRRLEVVGKDGKILDTDGGQAFKAIVEHAADHARIYEDLKKPSSQEISDDLATGNELVRNLRKFSMISTVNKLLGHYDKALLAEDVLNGVRGEGVEKLSVDAMLGKFVKSAAGGGLSLESLQKAAKDGHGKGKDALAALCKPAASFLETLEGTLGRTAKSVGNSGIVQEVVDRAKKAGVAIGGDGASLPNLMNQVGTFISGKPRGRG